MNISFFNPGRNPVTRWNPVTPARRADPHTSGGLGADADTATRTKHEPAYSLPSGMKTEAMGCTRDSRNAVTKTKDPDSKMRKGLEETLLRRRRSDGHGKMPPKSPARMEINACHCLSELLPRTYWDGAISDVDRCRRGRGEGGAHCATVQPLENRTVTE